MARRGERIGDAYVEVHYDGDKAGRAFAKNVEPDFREAGERSGEAFSRGFRRKVGGLWDREFSKGARGAASFSSRLSRIGPDLDIITIRTHRFADATGRAFGRRARNDFLNFVGAVVRGTLLATGGLFRMSVALVRTMGRLGEFLAIGVGGGEGFFGKIKGFGEGIAGFAQTFPRLAAAMKHPIIAIGALAAGFVTILILMQSLASLFATLGGAVVAVGLAIGGALVGGLTILAALLLPVVAGVGGLTAAILMMDDATKKATKQALEPFIASVKEIGKEFSKKAFAGLAADAKLFSDTIKNDDTFMVFAQQIGTALDEIRHRFTLAFTSPEFKQFLKDMGPVFAQQLHDLTSIVLLFGEALANVFRTISPVVDIFLSRLINVGIEFRNWTKTAGGQQAILDFFLRAEESLAAVSRLAVSLGRAFAVMFRLGGAEAGIGIIESIRGKVEQLVKFMRANPAAVRQFFLDSQAVIEAVGRALLGVINIFRALDTHASRQGVASFFTNLANILNVLAQVISFVTQEFDVLGQKFSIFSSITGVIGSVIPGVTQLKTAFTGAGAAFGDTATKVNSTKVSPNFDLSPLLQATETIKFTEEEMKALGIEFEKPKVPNIDVTPLESARVKIQEVVQAALDAGEAVSAHGGLASLMTFTTQLAKGLQGLQTTGVNIPVKPKVDPAALMTINGQITSSVAAAPAKVTPTMDPGALSGIKASVAGLSKGAKINITAGGNAQGVIARTKSALSQLTGTRSALNISAGGNAQGVIGRTKTALDRLMKTPTKLNISAGGNAQSVIRRTQSALDNLVGGSPYEVEIHVSKTGVSTGGIIPSEAKARGGLISMAGGGFFANFRQRYGHYEIGEAGREAVVPLNRPLGQVDPSVRLLAAFAQGKLAPSTVNNTTFNVTSNSDDPLTVAREVLALATASAY